MNEARLKEIAQHDPGCIVQLGISPCDCVRGELIAALRHAWQERGDYHSKWDHARRGYERVKDELVHKDAVIKALQQQYVNDMKPLVALREAVEAYVQALWPTHEGAEVPAERDLRRALDACRE